MRWKILRNTKMLRRAKRSEILKGTFAYLNPSWERICCNMITEESLFEIIVRTPEGLGFASG
jgi:hypothetical protein